MQSLSTPIPDEHRWASPTLLRTTLSQLRQWEAEAARLIAAPKADEEAWEGTEIDVRRTML